MTEANMNKSIILNSLEGTLKLKVFQKSHRPLSVDRKGTASKHVALGKKYASQRTALFGKRSFYEVPKIAQQTQQNPIIQLPVCYLVITHSFRHWYSDKAQGNSHSDNSCI